MTWIVVQREKSSKGTMEMDQTKKGKEGLFGPQDELTKRKEKMQKVAGNRYHV